MTIDEYVQSVIDYVPNELPLRDHIAKELRAHVAERMQSGQPLDDVLRSLGDPLKLAESYLAAEPIRSAPVGPRVVAKLIDFLVVAGIAALIACLVWFTAPEPIANFAPVIGIFICAFGFPIYTAVAEYANGWTLGKRVMGILVVRESGARISLGQSLLRQLPLLAQIFFIDALFALFTEKSQRAFELVTKTRTTIYPWSTPASDRQA
jgi:uncharacterized RDD family membrane protein YckC